MVRREQRRDCRGERGYNLVALVIGITILNIMLAAVLPLWSTAIRREQEEELIFRGLQYAEAIRVFQNRYHHLPNRLEELLEVKPRCIRQLWKDPLNKDGRWALVIQGQPLMNQGEGSNPADLSGVDSEAVPTGLNPTPGFGGGGKGTATAVGPIRGVYSLSSKESIATFLGQQRYNKWVFTVDLLQGGQTGGGQFQQQGQQQVQGGALVQSLRWIGRPMRPGLGGIQGAPPNGGFPTPNGPNLGSPNPNLPPGIGGPRPLNPPQPGDQAPPKPE